MAIPVLARLLDPSHFGLLALAMPFVLFGMAISDAGLGQSLVRVDQKDKLVWSSAFWLISAIGGGLSLFVLVLALPVSWLFNEPTLAPIVAVLAINPVIQGAVSPAIADLQQREKFQLLAAIEVISSLGALISALVLAFSGTGVWALVAQATLYWVIKALIVVLFTQFRPTMQFEWSALEGHITFSRDSALGNLVSFFQRQIDPLVIGKFLGAAPLGLYSMANRIVILPYQLMTAPAQNALFVKMVGLRHDRAAIRDLMVIASLAVAILVFPPLAIAAAASHAFFVVFLSERWADAAPVFSIIAPVAAVQTITALWTPMLLATENTTLRLRLNVEMTLMWLLILPFAAMQSIEIVAWAYTISYFAYSLLRSYAKFLSPVELKPSAYFMTMAAPILVAICFALLHLLIVWQFRPSPLIEVVIALGEMALAFGLVVAICWRKLRANVGALRSLLTARGAPQAEVADAAPS